MRVTIWGLSSAPPHITLQPLLLDLDFKLTTETQLPLKLCCQFAREVGVWLQEQLREDVRYVIVKKPKGYWATIKGEDVYKIGCHIYFTRSCIDVFLAERCRAFAVTRVRDTFHSIDYSNTEEDVVDSRLPARENGLIMIGDLKGKGKGGRYTVVCKGTLCFKTRTVKEHCPTRDEFLSTLEEYLHELYEFVFQEPEKDWVPRIKTPKAKAKATVQQGHQTQKKESRFNLSEFLRVTQGWVPGNEEYVKICMFCANQGRQYHVQQGLVASKTRRDLATGV